MEQTAARPGALVVGEDDAMRTSLSLYAGAAGLHPVAACGGLDALDALSGGLRPAVIVTGLDGLTLLERVRADTALCSTPVVVFSGRPEPEAGVDADAWLDTSQVNALIGTLHSLVKRPPPARRPVPAPSH